MDVLKEIGVNLPQEILDRNEKEGRCSGHCCVAFTFQLSKNDIVKFLELRKENPQATRFEREHRPGDPLCIQPSTYPDSYFEKLLEMLVDQDRSLNNGHNPATPTDGKFNGDLSDLSAYPGFFQCKHLNRETGDCMDYENRPDFCQNYPHDKVRGTCHYEGCTSVCSKKNVELREKENGNKGEDELFRLEAE